MKITKSILKQIILEELDSVKEPPRAKENISDHAKQKLEELFKQVRVLADKVYVASKNIDPSAKDIIQDSTLGIEKVLDVLQELFDLNPGSDGGYPENDNPDDYE